MAQLSNIIRGVIASLSVCAISSAAYAQTAALHDPITIVVGYAPGGAADTTARLYAEQLRKDGAGTVIVENKPGASGRIGLNYVKDSKPDGSTVYLVPSPLMTIFPLTYKNPGYDVEKDLRSIVTLVDIPTAIVTGADQPYDTMPAYVDWIKKEDGAANLGVATLGSSGHLGILAVNQNHGLNIEPVAYRGASPMLVDVASGEVSIGWDAVASMMPLYDSGKIKFIGVSGTERLKTLPDVPTLDEQGYPEFKAATSFYGIIAPAATPDDVAAAIEQAFMKASESDELKQQLANRGLLVAPQSGDEMAKRAKQELEFWRPIVAQTDISME